MSKPQGAIEMWAEYTGFQMVRLPVMALPIGISVRIGELLGCLAWLICFRRRRLAETALAEAMPELSPSDVRRTILKVCRHFGRGIVEAMRAKKILTKDNVERHIHLRNKHVLTRLLADGRPAIWVTGHFGVWELFGNYFALHEIPFATVYRPVKNPLVDRFLRNLRADKNQELIQRVGALRTMMRAIKQDKRHVGLLVDQHVRKEGIWVPFFGKLAATTPAPAAVALQTGAPIVIWHSRRLPGVYQFEIILDEPFTVERTDDRGADIERVTRRISDRLEELIREAPEQWLWLHRRWRTPRAAELKRKAAHGYTHHSSL